jgi:hypothetical protein
MTQSGHRCPSSIAIELATVPFEPLRASMKRRDFITLFCAAAAWPGTGRAQHSDQVRRIVVLLGNAENDPNGKAYSGAIRQGLQELGWS